MSIHTEHPNFDNQAAFDAMLAALAPFGFTDNSWHNDECPCIALEVGEDGHGNTLNVYVDALPSTCPDAYCCTGKFHVGFSGCDDRADNPKYQFESYGVFEVVDVLRGWGFLKSTAFKDWKASARYASSNDTQEIRESYGYDVTVIQFSDDSFIVPLMDGLTPVSFNVILGNQEPTFNTFDAAAAYLWEHHANKLPEPRVFSPVEWSDSLEALSAQYTDFMAINNFAPMCAVELIHENLTANQRAWVSDFIQAWDAVEGAE